MFYGSRYQKLGEVIFPPAPPLQPGLLTGAPAD